MPIERPSQPILKKSILKASMLSLDFDQLPKEQKTNILAEAIDAGAALLMEGVDQRLCILCCENGRASATLRASALIDSRIQSHASLLTCDEALRTS